MLKRLTLLLLAAAFLIVASPVAPATAKPLEKGDHGKRVVQLQRALHLRPADGVFGPGTHRAVKRFPRRHDIRADGIVGAGTWSMIRRARGAGRSRHSRPRRTSRRSRHASSHRGARSSRHSRSRRTAGRSRGGVRVTGRGPSVRLLQRRLGIRADGVFGSGTARAVKRLQRRRGMAADGVVGPATWAALGVRGRHPVLKRTRLRSVGARSRRVPVAVSRAIAAADRIARAPYLYGGGHATFNDTAYDCSGSISYVLHHAGRLRRPLDSSALASYGAPGRGRYITIYTSPGHAFMLIRGRRYDTSARLSGRGSRWTSAMRGTAGYTVRHPPGL